jgi:hypothetical protein
MGLRVRTRVLWMFPSSSLFVAGGHRVHEIHDWLGLMNASACDGVLEVFA